MLAENLELDNPELDVWTENTAGLRTGLKEARLTGQGKAPETGPALNLEPLSEQEVLES
jgi:hypothetical protein